MRRIVIFVFFVLAVAACSTTPGDAARRGGHYPQAADLYEAGAKQGDPLAARKLADLYNLRPGLPEDHKKAIYWYNKAIELGDISSYWFVGVIYRDGEGNVPKNYGLAEQYFLQGAEKGQHYSMYDLAGMYAEKRTKVSNDIESLKWLDIVTAFATACPSTNEGCQYILRDPKKIRETLESRMSSDQKQKAKELADRWVEDWKQKHK
jgi:TPR repeat protein